MNLRRTLQLETLLCFVGLGISVYLTWVYMSDVPVMCGSSGGCTTVQHSAYAWIVGVPIPMLGGFAYAMLVAVSIAALQWAERQELALLALVGVSLTGTGFSAYLTYVEIWILDAICRWCVASAVVMVGVCGLAFYAWRARQRIA